MTHQLRASVANQEPTSMVVLSSLLMRSSGGGGCSAPSYRRRRAAAAGAAGTAAGGSPAASPVVGAHALEDLEVVVRELAAVEVLAGRSGGRSAPSRRRSSAGAAARRSAAAASSSSLDGSKAMPQSASSSIARASPSKPEQDGPLHGGVLEELARQDGAEEVVLAEVHEAGVAAREVGAAARRAARGR